MFFDGVCHLRKDERNAGVLIEGCRPVPGSGFEAATLPLAES